MTLMFARFKGSLLLIVTCYVSHIVLFSFYEFFPWVSHIKVFNEEISIQGYMSYFLFFPTGSFKEDIQVVLKMCIAL
jgi:hypothetical protein